MIKVEVKQGEVIMLELDGSLCELAADVSTVISAIYSTIKKDLKDDKKAIKVFKDMMTHGMAMGITSVDLFDGLFKGKPMKPLDEKKVKQDEINTDTKNDFVEDFIKFLYSED